MDLLSQPSIQALVGILLNTGVVYNTSCKGLNAITWLLQSVSLPRFSPTSWSRIPNLAIVPYTSNLPRIDIETFLDLQPKRLWIS